MVDSQSVLNYQREVFREQNSLVVVYSDLNRDLIITTQGNGIEYSQHEKSSRPPRSLAKIDAIYGIMQLKAQSYLVVVTKSSLVGTLMGRQILLAEKFEFLPIESSRISSEDKQVIAGLQAIFSTKTFYYSENYDLTNSLQRQIENKGNRQPVPQYFINQEYAKPLRFCNPELWVPLFISGLVLIKFCKVNQMDLQIALISRRDSRRMGRRFISRGADLDGNCSNFAETEQIVVAVQRQHFYSFVQTRGSMPFRWVQKPDLKWAPKGQILGTDTQNREIAEKHIQDQQKLGIQKIVLVNLIDQKGNQKLLGDYFTKTINQFGSKFNLRYIWFDFHHECRSMKYQNLSKLIDMIKPDLDMGGYFEMEMKDETKKYAQVAVRNSQSAIIRTNCVDCLDRTNVVQSVIARYIVWGILGNYGVARSTVEVMESFPIELETLFRDMWVRNADTISLVYTGTGALKTDSIKKGKRTKMGAFSDGYRSLRRYFIGNFQDGDIQNSIDVLTSKIDLRRQKISKPWLPGILTFFALVKRVSRQFVGIGLLSFRVSDELSRNNWVQNKLGLMKQTQSTTKELDQLKLSSFQLVFVIGTLLLLKSVLFKKHKWFVRQSTLNH